MSLHQGAYISYYFLLGFLPQFDLLKSYWHATKQRTSHARESISWHPSHAVKMPKVPIIGKKVGHSPMNIEMALTLLLFLSQFKSLLFAHIFFSSDMFSVASSCWFQMVIFFFIVLLFVRFCLDDLILATYIIFDKNHFIV